MMGGADYLIGAARSGTATVSPLDNQQFGIIDLMLAENAGSQNMFSPKQFIPGPLVQSGFLEIKTSGPRGGKVCPV
jgi:hypothetical protein